MMIFCTLFDSKYLSRGLAMYESLRQHCPDFQLYIFPFDTTSYNILESMKLANVTLISLSEFEDSELLRIKSTRTKAEYCWTATSSTILFILEKYSAPHCTYIDSDLFFYSNPSVLVGEMGNSSILLTEHRYSQEYIKSLIFGKYCVQFITFCNNEKGLTALRWWRNACLDWCYNREEDGKFGDQKYLDDWTERFEGVHLLQHLGGGVAPWNVQQYLFTKKDNKVACTEILTNTKFDMVFYHFHYVRFYPHNKVDLGDYQLNDTVKSILYKPYLVQLERMKEKITKINATFDPHGPRRMMTEWKSPYIFLKRKYYDRYNIYSLSEILT